MQPSARQTAARALGVPTRRQWFVAAVVSAACTGPALAPCNYEVTVNLHYPINCGMGNVITVGIGLNEHGAIVGYYKCPISKYSEAFLWTPEEGYVTLPRPPGVLSSGASDINDDGVIVGTYLRDGAGFRGFVYENARYTELPPLPGGAWSQAVAVNNAKEVTGYRSIGSKTDPILYNAYVWSPSAGVVDLGLMSGGISAGTDMSETGVVVGWTGGGSTIDAFRWQEGNLLLLGPIPGGFTSEPFAVNDSGVIVGSGRFPMKGAPVGAWQAFYWRNGEFTLLGALPDHAWSSALGVSADGYQIVGTSWNVNGSPNIDNAFLWQNGVMTNLEEVIDADLDLSAANRVNKRGQILAAWALLTPVGEPLGDLDHDCSVGIVDFLLLLGHWGGGGAPDLDGSGAVDAVDLAILLDSWG
jgi:probable HAF family extracellular repeat protein